MDRLFRKIPELQIIKLLFRFELFLWELATSFTRGNLEKNRPLLECIVEGETTQNFIFSRIL